MTDYQKLRRQWREELELNRLNGLSREELEKEYQSWFEGAIAENMKILDNNTLRSDMIDDFIKWKQDYSIEELQAQLLNY